MANKQEKPTVSSPTFTALLCCDDDYNSFNFSEGQKFRVVNALYEIKKIDGDLFVLDPDNYGSKVKQEGKSDYLKFAIEQGFNVEQLAT